MAATEHESTFRNQPSCHRSWNSAVEGVGPFKRRGYLRRSRTAEQSCGAERANRGLLTLLAHVEAGARFILPASSRPIRPRQRARSAPAATPTTCAHPPPAQRGGMGGMGGGVGGGPGADGLGRAGLEEADPPCRPPLPESPLPPARGPQPAGSCPCRPCCPQAAESFSAGGSRAGSGGILLAASSGSMRVHRAHECCRCLLPSSVLLAHFHPACDERTVEREQL